MLDKLLLSVLRERSKFHTLLSSVPQDMLGTTTQYMLGAYRSYFEAFPDSTYVNFDTLATHVRLKGNASDKQMAAFDALVAQLKDYSPSAADRAGIVDQLIERDTAGRAGALLERYDSGEDLDIIWEMARLADSAKRSRGQTSVTDCVDTDVFDVMEKHKEGNGVKFPLLCLQEGVRSLALGDTVAIAARPDSGKTSFIASTLVYMAAQAHKLWPGRPILWFNNEGLGENILPRLYQAAMDITVAELGELGKKDKQAAHKAYEKALGAPRNIIRIKDMHGATLAKAEQVIEALNPCIVVWDMMANFKLASVGDGNSNKASMVEQLWQEAREMAAKHECISIGTVQVSADGKNEMFPSLDALKDSKTGIQGAVDLIVMVGSVDNPEMQARRGISTPKNKRQVPGKPSNIRSSVIFKADRCQWEDA